MAAQNSFHLLPVVEKLLVVKKRVVKKLRPADSLFTVRLQTFTF